MRRFDRSGWRTEPVHHVGKTHRHEPDSCEPRQAGALRSSYEAASHCGCELRPCIRGVAVLACGRGPEYGQEGVPDVHLNRPRHAGESSGKSLLGQRNEHLMGRRRRDAEVGSDVAFGGCDGRQTSVLRNESQILGLAACTAAFLHNAKSKTNAARPSNYYFDNPNSTPPPPAVCEHSWRVVIADW
jgi:hypothetical protein